MAFGVNVWNFPTEIGSFTEANRAWNIAARIRGETHRRYLGTRRQDATWRRDPDDQWLEAGYAGWMVARWHRDGTLTLNAGRDTQVQRIAFRLTPWNICPLYTWAPTKAWIGLTSRHNVRQVFQLKGSTCTLSPSLHGPQFAYPDAEVEPVRTVSINRKAARAAYAAHNLPAFAQWLRAAVALRGNVLPEAAAKTGYQSHWRYVSTRTLLVWAADPSQWTAALLDRVYPRWYAETSLREAAKLIRKLQGWLQRNTPGVVCTTYRPSLDMDSARSAAQQLSKLHMWTDDDVEAAPPMDWSGCAGFRVP